MKQYYINSLFYRAGVKLKVSYSHSHFKKFASACSNVYKNSRLYALLHEYLRREPQGKKSVTYKVFRQVFNSLDKVVKNLVRLFASSVIVKLAKGFAGIYKDDSSAGKNKLAACFLLTFASGYALVNTFLWSWNILRLTLVLVMLLAAAFTYRTMYRWTDWFRDSIFYKIMKTLFEYKEVA